MRGKRILFFDPDARARRVAERALAATGSVVHSAPDCEGVLGCRLDVDRDGQVGGADIGLLLGAWGATTPESWQLDLDANGQIDGADLGALLAAWGPCPR